MDPAAIATAAFEALVETICKKYSQRPKETQFPHVVFMVNKEGQIVGVPPELLTSAQNSKDLLIRIRALSQAYGAVYILFASEVWLSEEQEENLPVSERSDARSAIFITLEGGATQRGTIIPIGEDDTLGEPFDAPVQGTGRFTDLLGRMEFN